MSKAAELVEQAVHETFAYRAFPDIHRRKIRTNTPLARAMRNVRRPREIGAIELNSA